MKKALLILLLAGFVIACNNADDAGTANFASDRPVKTPDTIKVIVVDTTKAR